VPIAVLDRQIDILNRSYSSATGGVDTPFRFRRAGLDRTTNVAWFSMTRGSPEEAAAKSALGIKNKRVLNIYTSGVPSPTLGWATWPWDFAGNPNLDGVVVGFRTLPGAGGGPPFNEGDTAVHEAGHWLGAFHTFEGGCTADNDFVSDTPAEATEATGCPQGRDTCTGPQFPGPDPVTNFLDYTEDACMFKFTAGQSSRMDTMFAIHREG